MSAQPLKDIRVLEFGQFAAAPYAAEVLADLGAEVIKVEHPDGDGIRSWGPHPGGQSAPCMAFNRAKRSIAVDFRSPRGQDVIRRMYDRADVVIENYRPGVTNKYGLGAEAARARNPRLIYCSISGFGQRGDGAERPAFDLILQGITGMMDMTGEPGRAPAKVPVPIADGTAALHATTAILAALHERERSGVGATIDVSLQASTLTWMMLVAAGYFADGRTPARLGRLIRWRRLIRPSAPPTATSRSRPATTGIGRRPAMRWAWTPVRTGGLRATVIGLAIRRSFAVSSRSGLRPARAPHGCASSTRPACHAVRFTAFRRLWRIRPR